MDESPGEPTKTYTGALRIFWIIDKNDYRTGRLPFCS